MPTETLSHAPPLLLLLHGIGSNEDDLLGLAPYLDQRFLIVSARAPIFLGPGAYAWFSIEFTPGELVANLIEAERSRLTLLRFIDELITHYGANRAGIYLMGFSQGAMMALSAALTAPEKATGVIAMSGRLPAEVLDKITQPQALRGMPIFLSHGEYDPVIPIEFGRAARLNLENLSVDLTYREYSMGHEVNMDSLRDVAGWLAANLNRKLHLA